MSFELEVRGCPGPFSPRRESSKDSKRIMFWFFASMLRFLALAFSELLEFEFEFSSGLEGGRVLGGTKFQFIILLKLVMVLSKDVMFDLSKTDSRSLFGIRSSEKVSC